MNDLQIFNNNEFGQVRVITIADKEYFNGKDIASPLGYKRTVDAVRQHCKERGTVKHRTLTNGGLQNMTYIDEGNLYRLVANSKLPQAERFESWIFDEVIPSIRKAGSYIADKRVRYLEQLEGVRFIAEDLKVNPASKILMYQMACEANNVDPSFLPAYSDEKITKSLTVLLKQFNVGCSTVKFNTKLIQAGILEESTRPSTKTPNKIKKFKRLTDKGLKYGKNIISPNNQRETQPHYYEDMFEELIKEVK